MNINGSLRLAVKVNGVTPEMLWKGASDQGNRFIIISLPFTENLLITPYSLSVVVGEVTGLDI